MLTVPVAASADYWMVTVRGARDASAAVSAMRSAPRPTASGSITISGPVMSEKQLADLLAPREVKARQLVVQKQQALRDAPAPAIDMAPARAALAQQVARSTGTTAWRRHAQDM